MSFKLLTQRLFSLSRNTRASPVKNRRVSSPSAVLVKAAAPFNHQETNQENGDDGVFRRSFYSNTAVANLDVHRFFPTGEKLMERLRGMGAVEKERSVRINSLMAPAVLGEEEGDLTVADVKKILQLSQLENLKARLRQIEKANVSRSEFLQICAQESSSSDQAIEFAKLLDESGDVIVIGNVVFLRPEQVMKAIQGVIAPQKQKDSRLQQELEEMEEEKAVIDKRAESHALTVLRCGLAYLVVQTASFMRLTFWELNWDVMEPLCFFATSMFCIGGYAFYLRTSKEPSFQGIFQNRFESKQRRLMKQRNFDAGRYNELRKACFPDYLAPPQAFAAGSRRT